MKPAIWAAALAVLVTGIGSAQGEVATQQDEFDATVVETMVQAAAEEAARLYGSDGKEAFGDITGLDPDKAEYPIFVLNSTTGEIVAYAGHPQMVGSVLSGVFAADRPYDEVMEDLRGGEGAWITTLFTNEDIRANQMARIWMTLSDGYVFAAGYYLSDFRIQALVDKIVSVYDDDKDAAYAMINSLHEEYEDIYITAISLFQQIIAISHYPDRVGDHWSDHYNTYQSSSEIIAILIHGGTWVNNIEVNLATDIEQMRRSWVQQHDGIIYATGYFIADSAAKSAVDLALLTYEDEPETAFDRITFGGRGNYTDAAYPFVINGTTHQMVAHGANPEFVDKCCSNANQETGDLPLDDVIEEIRSDGPAWFTYNVTNPDSGIVLEKRAWLAWHDGFIFGSGYHLYDSLVESIVAQYSFAYAESEDVNRLDTPAPESHIYHFVIDTETMEVVVHGGGAELAADDSLSLTAADRSADDILADLESSHGTWSEYTTTNPETGMQEHKRSWLTMQGKYVFGAGYYDSDLG